MNDTKLPPQYHQPGCQTLGERTEVFGAVMPHGSESVVTTRCCDCGGQMVRKQTQEEVDE